jgi:hypothetical protein
VTSVDAGKLQHDFELHRKLKQTQYQVMVTELDTLKDFKTDVRKKMDYLSGKSDSLAKLCHQTVDKLIRQFERV